METAIATATADSKGTQWAGWSSFDTTIDDVESGSSEEIVTVNANNPAVMAEVTSIFRAHKANVSSGYGCRLTRVLGSQFYITGTRDQINGVNAAITARLASRSKAAARVEDFRAVNKYAPSHEIAFFVGRDRPGVLATAFEVIAKHGVNVVTMAAATGPAIDHDPDASGETYWGRASVKAYIEDPATFWKEFKSVARQEGWDWAAVTPVMGDGRRYRWDRKQEVSEEA